VKIHSQFNVPKMDTTEIKENRNESKDKLKKNYSTLIKISLISAISIILISLTMNSCKKKDAATTPYSVRMTDAPGPYDEVLIDLKSVEVTGNGGTTVTLNTIPGIYNLLNFSNGIDTMIATGQLGLSSVEQIRLILGTNNNVVINNIAYPLSTPSAEQSGLKLQVHQTLQAGVAYYVLLDFDANQSIVDEGNGKYKLKPVIRTVETALSGAITGKILPIGTMATVTVTSNGVTYSSPVNSLGNFVIKGLAAGTYSVTVTPASPLNPVTVNNINVAIGISTDMGTIQL
jgi:hypothetical protein